MTLLAARWKVLPLLICMICGNMASFKLVELWYSPFTWPFVLGRKGFSLVMLLLTIVIDREIAIIDNDNNVII